MLAQNLLVDEISLDPLTRLGMVNSTLYEFSSPKWMSFHSDREGDQIGPLTILKDEGATDGLMDSSIISFGSRELNTEGGPDRPLVSFQDRWTVPFYTLYALVLPHGFVAEEIKLICPEELGWSMPLQMGFNNDRLFYHTIFAEHRNQQHIFEIRALLRSDPKLYRELIDSAEIIEGTSGFQQLGWSIVEETKNPRFWFRLLEIGSKSIPG